MSERYKEGSTIGRGVGRSPVRLHDEREAVVARAAYQAGREEALGEAWSTLKALIYPKHLASCSIEELNAMDWRQEFECLTADIASNFANPQPNNQKGEGEK